MTETQQAQRTTHENTRMTSMSSPFVTTHAVDFVPSLCEAL